MPLTIKQSEPLSAHTVFRIGGPARYFVTVESQDDFIAALSDAARRGRPWYILGAGSNVLVSDRGFDGTLIHPVSSRIEIQGHRVRAEAGVAMARVVAESLASGLRGFEWAIGVPGTIGGSVRGNAGCFGREMKDVIESVVVLDVARSEVRACSGREMQFGYRESLFKRRPELVILEATLKLNPGDVNAGRSKLQEYAKARTGQVFEASGREFFNPAGRLGPQEVGVPSAGSIFKNVLWSRQGIDTPYLLQRFPEFRAFEHNPGLPAGFLIDQVGLRGSAVGGAMISQQHANFIINTGSATAAEVIALVGIAKEGVERTFGIRLEEEIQYVGFEE